MTFDSLSLIEPIRRALAEEGYTTPTPIQEEAIPVALQGKDILGCAQTGTGKTAAFAIPILQLLHQQDNTDKSRKAIKVLIVTPTRELALQIGESFDAYGRFLKIRNTVVFGGVPQNAQTQALQRGVDVLVATPGRLLDLMHQGFISLKSISILVLDEADRMLDMGFIHDVKKILAVVPQKRQTLFFSATMPPEIVKLSNSILHQPVKIEVTPVSSTVDIIAQSVYFVEKANKCNLLLHILQNKSIQTALVFTRTKHGADKVTRILNRYDVKSEAIHGNKSQNARQKALNNFKSRITRVLVASDIAARGIDIDDLSCVINFDVPNIPETYVHRIGRTGRAGADGLAISFCDVDEKPFLKDIQKLIQKSIPIISDHPFPMSDQTAIVISDEKKQTNRAASPKKQNHYRKPSLIKSGSNESTKRWR